MSDSNSSFARIVRRRGFGTVGGGLLLAAGISMAAGTAVAATEYQTFAFITVNNAPYVNDVGVQPSAMIGSADGTYLGSARTGGPNGSGTVFRFDTQGTVTLLHAFDSLSTNPAGIEVNSEGAQPMSLVGVSDGVYFGAAATGGANGGGTLFSIGDDGSLKVLHTFGATQRARRFSRPINDDGANPGRGFVAGGDGAFYGLTYAGGQHGFGTVFKIDGAGNFSTIYHLEYVKIGYFDHFK